jgi:hypothetical protein
MKAYTGWIAGLALAAASLSAGTVRAADPPPHGGTITIYPKTASGDYDPSLTTYANAAREALTDKGFTTLEDPAHTLYVAELTLDRAAIGTGFTKDRGGASASVAGTAVVVPFSTGQSKAVTLQRTRIEIRIKTRGDGAVVWDGSAVTVRPSGTAKGNDATVAADLSRALLSGYPEQPEDTVGVP